jgi:hypothetical protein
MNFNSYKEYMRLCEMFTYYHNRWDYYSAVMEMINRSNIEGRVLEMGSMQYLFLQIAKR